MCDNFSTKMQRESTGDGLGLALVHEIVLLHRGDFCESQVGKGTTDRLHVSPVE